MSAPLVYPATSQESSNNKGVIMITGSSGLIGTALIKQLARQYTVIGLDNPGEPYPPSEAICLNMDLTSDEDVQRVFAQVKEEYGSRIASFIHLAAYYDFKGKPSPLYDKITVQGTGRVLRYLQQMEVEQFVFSSSLLVYDSTVPGKKITEDSPLNPKWDYPKSKVKTEKLIHEQRGTIPAVILRISGIYNEWGNSIPISNQLQRIYENQITSHFYPGNTAHGNVFMHLDDLVTALVNTVEKRQALPPEVVINLGEPDTVSYEEMQTTIGKLLHGKQWNTYRIPKPLAKAGAWVQDLFGDPFIKPWMVDMADDHSEINIQKAKALLDWEPKHSLRKTLPVMIENLKKYPKQFYKENGLK